MATTGTHDIEPLAATLTEPECASGRRSAAVSGLVLVADSDAGRFRLDRSHQHAGVVDEINWTWKVPRPVDTWGEWVEARERQSWLRDLTRATGR